MRLLLALAFGFSLSAQHVKIIAQEKRVDVSAFTYTDFPNQTNKFLVEGTKGKVAVIAFLSEGFKGCFKALKELNWLQDKEKSMDLVVIPIYDLESRKVINVSTTTYFDTGRHGNGMEVVKGDPGEGMLALMPVSFKVFMENAAGHLTLFPKFEGQPAVFIIDRQGRIASTLYGYEKGLITKAAQAVMDEK